MLVVIIYIKGLIINSVSVQCCATAGTFNLSCYCVSEKWSISLYFSDSKEKHKFYVTIFNARVSALIVLDKWFIDLFLLLVGSVLPAVHG